MAPRRTSRDKSAQRQTTFGAVSTQHVEAKMTSKKSTVKGPNATADRVETDVLLAIQPTHLKNIVSGDKNHEYRKYRLRDGVERLWLYETRGTKQEKGAGAITHIATIPPNIRHTPGTVPEEPVGLGNAEFNAGQKQSKYGYPILEVYKLIRPITLDEMKKAWGMGAAPMGWSLREAAHVARPMGR